MSGRRGRSILALAVAAFFSAAGWSADDPPLPESPDSFTPSAEFQQWITDIVREQPARVRKRKLGQQAQTFDGLRSASRTASCERTASSPANDGSAAVRVKLDPAERFDVTLANIRQLPSGKVGLDILVVASLKFLAANRWEHGVLFSISAEADARAFVGPG
jgi:hypothetical protein